MRIALRAKQVRRLYSKKQNTTRTEYPASNQKQ